MIQSYELEERRQLLENYVSGAHWQDRMSAYLERLGGPSGTDSRAVEWLADHALELDFADNRALYLTESSRLLQKSLFERAVADPAERARFDAAVRQLALHMGFSQDNLQLYNTVDILSALRSVAMRLFDEEETPACSTYMPQLADIPLGFKLDDELLESATKVLRLLYLEDLRNIQSDINDLIEHIQRFTAISSLPEASKPV